MKLCLFIQIDLLAWNFSMFLRCIRDNDILTVDLMVYKKAPGWVKANK